MGNVQVPMKDDAVPVRESLAKLGAALRDGIAALIGGRLDEFAAAVEVQSIEADRTRTALRSQTEEDLAPEILAGLREAAVLCHLFNSHLRKLGTSIGVAKHLRLLIENKYPGTTNHVIPSSLSLKV